MFTPFFLLLIFNSNFELSVDANFVQNLCCMNVCLQPCCPDLQLRSLYHVFLLVQGFSENYTLPRLVLYRFLILQRRYLFIQLDKMLGVKFIVSNIVSCMQMIVFLVILLTLHVQNNMR